MQIVMEYIRIQKNKIKVKIFLILFSLILFGGCEYPEKIPVTKGRMADKVSYEAAKELKEEKLLYLCGTGGRIMDKICTIALSFSYYKPITIEEGRELVICATKKLVEKINTEPQIYPYLYKYPFPPTCAEIRIFVETNSYSPIEIVSFVDGVINYKIEDPENKLLRTVYHETYAEGLEKLNHSSQ